MWNQIPKKLQSERQTVHISIVIFIASNYEEIFNRKNYQSSVVMISFSSTRPADGS